MHVASYSGGRDHEDCGLKPVWANSSQDPTSKKKKKKNPKIGLVEWHIALTAETRSSFFYP
jgi:hypothetical protein